MRMYRGGMIPVGIIPRVVLVGVIPYPTSDHAPSERERRASVASPASVWDERLVWTPAVLFVTNAEPDATNDLSTHDRLRGDSVTDSRMHGESRKSISAAAHLLTGDARARPSPPALRRG
jgi:hypothetical protein